jgi:hypothetical protein
VAGLLFRHLIQPLYWSLPIIKPMPFLLLTC